MVILSTVQASPARYIKPPAAGLAKLSRGLLQISHFSGQLVVKLLSDPIPACHQQMRRSFCNQLVEWVEGVVGHG